MSSFAIYLHTQVVETSRPVDQIRFVGHSLPYFSLVRQELEKALSDYPALPVRRTEYGDYLRVHTQVYLEKIEQVANAEEVTDPPRLSIECTGLEYCLPGYFYSLGGMLEAIDRMRAGTLERAYCFSLPGHHAYADWGHGYCLLNPQAAAARYAQENVFSNVLIVDWDHHHGDGTQSIFANDSSVYCISIHSAADLYMASTRVLRDGTTTAAEKVGHCNIPLLSRSYSDQFPAQMNLDGKFYRASESLDAFREALDQIPWTPDLIFIFSGYDAHKDDCGAGISDWTNTDFEQLTRHVIDLAKRSSAPILSVHGGGYRLPVTLAAAISHVEVLASYK